MIPRYDKSEISQLWTEEYKYQTLLKVELALLQAEEGELVPAGTSGKIAPLAKIRVDRINEIERQVNHDIIAFCTSITEQLPNDLGKYFHFGATSSDIIDTGTSLQIKHSLEKILPVLRDVIQILSERARETKDLVTLGRSHGMYAEPMSFGQKFLGFYAEFSRRYAELKHFCETECTAQFSGAVGNYTILTPEIEKKAAKILGLPVEPVSTQVLPRDRIAKLLSINALLAGAIERLAVEIRHLHRSEVDELQEGFSAGQKGSSTMPHKKNPIAAENLTGLSRVIRSHCLVGYENIPLWHERDISHSSAERMVLPDNLGLTFYCLGRLRSTLANLEIHNAKIEKRVTESFQYLSSYYLHQLLEHTSLSREESYKIVQEASFKAESAVGFYEEIQRKVKDNLKGDLHLPTLKEIKNIYLKHVDEVFQRTFSLYG